MNCDLNKIIDDVKEKVKDDKTYTQILDFLKKLDKKEDNKLKTYILGRIINEKKITGMDKFKECLEGQDFCDALLYKLVEKVKTQTDTDGNDLREAIKKVFEKYPYVDFRKKISAYLLIYHKYKKDKDIQMIFKQIYEKKCTPKVFDDIFDPEDIKKNLNITDNNEIADGASSASPADSGATTAEKAAAEAAAAQAEAAASASSQAQPVPPAPQPPSSASPPQVASTVASSSSVSPAPAAGPLASSPESSATEPPPPPASPAPAPAPAAGKTGLPVAGGSKRKLTYHLCSTSVHINKKKFDAKSAREAAKMIAEKIFRKTNNKSAKFSLKRIIDNNRVKYYYYDVSIDNQKKISINSV